LAYPIAKVHKAHYVMMNIECDQGSLDELESAFRFNDAVIRNLVIRRDEAITEPSPLVKSRDEREESEERSRPQAAVAQDLSEAGAVDADESGSEAGAVGADESGSEPAAEGGDDSASGEEAEIEQ